MLLRSILVISIIFKIICVASVSSFATEQKLQRMNSNKLLLKQIQQTSLRHKVIADNIANINTPGYKAKDVQMAKDAEKMIASRKRLKLATTSSKHITRNTDGADNAKIESIKDYDEIKMNGNTVSMRQQLEKLSENQLDYEVALQAYKANTSLLSVALGKGN